MPRTTADRFKTAMQVVAVLCIVAYFVVLAHKGSADIMMLASRYEGSEFWRALGRHLLRNLGGG